MLPWWTSWMKQLGISQKLSAKPGLFVISCLLKKLCFHTIHVAVYHGMEHFHCNALSKLLSIEINVQVTRPPSFPGDSFRSLAPNKFVFLQQPLGQHPDDTEYRQWWYTKERRL